MLGNGHPQVSLMFTGKKNQYSIKKVPGCISVPYNFTVNGLKAFVEENVN